MIFACKHLNLASHVWMQRTLEHLATHTTAVATDQASYDSWCLEKIDKACVSPVWHSTPPTSRRILGRVTGSSNKVWSSEPARRFKLILNKYPTTPVLIHFLDVAVELRNQILECENPVFVFVHGSDFAWSLVNENGTPLRNGEAYKHQCLELAHKIYIIANSTYTRDEIVRAGFPTERVFIKHFGMPITRVTRYRPDSEQLKLLFLGRLVDFKGPEKLIEAFSIAVKNGLNGELLIAGDGPLMKECKQRISKHALANRVHMLGEVTRNEADILRQEADIFTAHNCTGSKSKRVETFGVSILEAMASGIPVVTGRSGGIVDMITDQVNGFLFEPGNIDAHAEILIRLGENKTLRERIGAMAQKTVQENFSIEKETETLLSIVAAACKQDAHA